LLRNVEDLLFGRKNALCRFNSHNKQMLSSVFTLTEWIAPLMLGKSRCSEWIT